jgi:multisubunit Na+/H+ antiporter MnhC subunit
MPDSTLFPIYDQASPIVGPTGGTRTYIQASANGAATALTATLAGTAGKTTFISGFSVTGSGATGATSVIVTITGIGTTMSYIVTVPAGANANVAEMFIEFADPIPASAVNTAIVISVPSFGVGNLFAAVNAHGFQQ